MGNKHCRPTSTVPYGNVGDRKPLHKFKIYKFGYTEAIRELDNGLKRIKAEPHRVECVNGEKRKEAYYKAMELINKEIKKGNMAYIKHFTEESQYDALEYLIEDYDRECDEEQLLDIINCYDNLDRVDKRNMKPSMLIKENIGKSRNVVKAILDKTHDYSTVYNGDHGQTTLNRLMKYTKFEDMMLKVLETLDDNHINNTVLYDGNRHIHNAIYYGHYQVARELVNRGCNINVVNNNDFTPIALSDNVEFTKYLIEKSADINLGTSALRVALIFTESNANYSNIKITKSVRHEIALLLAKHPLCDVDKYLYGYHNIRYSIDNRWHDVTIAIAERSKRLDSGNCAGKTFSSTPFEYAVMKYKENNDKENDVITFLAIKSKIFTSSISLFTLNIAKTDTDLALQILSNKTFNMEKYILMYETFNSVVPHNKLVELLDNVKDESLSTKFSKNNVTALIWACKNEYEDMALKILKRYIDIYQTDSMGRSAIYYVNKHKLSRVARRIKEIKKENEEIYIDTEPDDLEEININCIVPIKSDEKNVMKM